MKPTLRMYRHPNGDCAILERGIAHTSIRMQPGETGSDAVRRYITESRDGLRAAEARLARLESDLNAALEN